VGIAVTSHDTGLLSMGYFEIPVFEGNKVSVAGWMLY
jgi:hypothetical protein